MMMVVVTWMMMMMMTMMMMMMYTQYDGIKESNTGKDISPPDPTVAKLVIVSLRIFYHLSHPKSYHVRYPNYPVIISVITNLIMMIQTSSPQMARTSSLSHPAGKERIPKGIWMNLYIDIYR